MTYENSDVRIDVMLAMRASGGGFWRVNLCDQSVYWDEVTRELFGTPTPETSDQFFELLVHPDDSINLRAAVKSIQPGDPMTLEYRSLGSDGAVRWMRCTAAVEHVEGRPAVMHGVVFDITHRKRLEAELVEVQKHEALARLSANAARDFDNLITVILGSVELVTNEEQSETARQLLETIRIAAEQASELTRGMLLFGERAEARPLVTEIGGLLGAATPVLRQGLGRQHVLTMDVRDTPMHVYIDPAQLQLMLLNLVVNARHAMPTGGKVTMILSRRRVGSDVSDLAAGSYVSLVVQDEGVGISEEALPMIFEPFYTTRGPGEGAGLGLAAVRGIVRSAGGAIHASSAPNSGTRFEIFLPLRPPPHSDGRTTHDVELTLGQREGVLFVDDDPMIQRVFKSVLTEFGFEVDAFGSAADALEALEQGSYDILISDVVMPEMSGFELADAVSERWPDLPLVLLSGKAHEDGRYEFLLKPIRPSGLALKIREMLDAR